MFWWQPKIKNRPPSTQPQVVGIAPSSSDLWDLILDMNWEQVLQHVQEHPQDAQWSDGHWHETPLHLACQQNAPIHVIRAVVQAYPPALLIPNGATQKDLPIHIACRYQVHEEILRELLKDYPETALGQTKWGRTPMVALWNHRPTEKSSDNHDDNASEICPQFWTKIQVILEAVARFRQFTHRQKVPKTRIQERDEEALDDELHRVTAVDAMVDSSETLLMVHAAVSLGALQCPIQVLEHVVRKFPEQVSIKDPRGELPLHIAVGPASWNSSTRRQYKPREEQFISLLLSVHPGAAQQCMARDHNRLPLHTAIVNRHTWKNGVESLFRACPDVLLIPDPVTKLYPFQLAALPVRDNKIDLDTVYSLLRSRPDVLLLMDLAPEQQQQQSPPQPTPPELDAKNHHQCNPSVLRLVEHCPRDLQDVLLGTAAALLIGSVAGVLLGVSK